LVNITAMISAEIGNRTDSVLQLFLSILVFVLVLAITYFVTKWIGSYQQNQMKNSNMEVIETMRIMNGKCIQIVRIVDEYIVIAVCKDSVTFLTKLEDFTIDKKEEVVNDSFKDVLEKLKLKKK